MKCQIKSPLEKVRQMKLTSLFDIENAERVQITSPSLFMYWARFGEIGPWESTTGHHCVCHITAANQSSSLETDHNFCLLKKKKNLVVVAM